MGYTAGYFSFNTEGGRCEECKGDGTVTVEMQFMADLVLECASCHGKRFKSDTLEIKFQDKSIYDILEMTVNQVRTSLLHSFRRREPTRNTSLFSEHRESTTHYFCIR